MSRALSVVAIIAAYNESDIIEGTVRDLIANGVLVYLIDDGSTDDTARLIEPLVGRGVVGIERLPNPRAANGSRTFSLERLVRRKAQLAAEMDADWFINHDADEFRESPWAGVSLLDGIRRVDASGYNAIDFINLDFWPTPDRTDPGDDVRQAFVWYSDAEPYNRVQVRCWRKTSRIEVASTGGHDVQFDNRRVFPIRFISRHYPIRGQAHGERKVFAERRPQFSPKERARKWHVQYDGIKEGTSFIRETCELTCYDGDAVRMALAMRHRGVEALEASAAELRSALDALQRALDAASRDVQTAHADIARQTGQIAELQAVVGRLTHDLTCEREESRHLRDVVATQNIAIELRDAQLAEARAAIAALGDEITRRERDIVAARVDVAMRDRDLASHVRELAATRAALADTRDKLDDTHRSWSWRVTSPARMLLRSLRGY